MRQNLKVFMRTIKKLISSYKTTLVLLTIYAILLAIATLIEKFWGTNIAKSVIYYSPLFFLLQFFMVINFIAIFITRNRKKRKWGFLLIHFSLIIILTGAFVSHVFGEEGILHIREGKSSNKLLIETNKGIVYKTLPFEIELINFRLIRYPASTSPSSYESEIVIHEKGQKTEQLISMNNVLDLHGYRFFQSSFDQDEKGTILSVNKDVSGRNITYFGYFFLFIGFILIFIEPNSRFRQLIRQLKKIQLVGLFLLIIPAISVFGKESDSNKVSIPENTIDKEHARKFGSLVILNNSGRIKPINTFSSELLRKLHKSYQYENLNSDQWLLSVLAYPEEWMSVPFILNKNTNLSTYYDLPKGYCSYLDAFDNSENYKLTEKLQEAFHKPISDRSKFDKDLLKLDEQFNIFHQLINYQLINIFPKESEGNTHWFAPGDDLSIFDGQDSTLVSQSFLLYIHEVRNAIKTKDWSNADHYLDIMKNFQLSHASNPEINIKQIESELLYNQLDIFRLCKKIYLILGGILLALSFISFFQDKNWLKWGFRFFSFLVVFAFLYHLFGIALRAYISGYAPWSNSYETMVYVSFITILAGLLFARKSRITLALSVLFGGIILFVSGLNWMDPQINPLVPVLKSPWLMFHVAVIVAAYGFFGICSFVGLTNLVLFGFFKNKTNISFQISKLTIINELSMYIGLALMTIGTFLGAIWANESWGRYWGWDPKETWALITLVFYSITLHLRLVKQWDNPKLFNWLAVIGILIVLMTFFGVNYLLSGMHSYA